MTGLPALTILVALPLLFGVATLLLPKGADRAVKVLGIVGTSAVFVWTVLIMGAYSTSGHGMSSYGRRSTGSGHMPQRRLHLEVSSRPTLMRLGLNFVTRPGS